MNKILLSLLLAWPLSAHPEVQERIIKTYCGSESDLKLTLKKYQEVPVIMASNESGFVYSIWANLETQTSTWVVRVQEPNTYCVIGVGDSLNIFDPNEYKTKIQHSIKPRQ